MADTLSAMARVGLPAPAPVRELEGGSELRDIITSGQPALLRGMAADWPAVVAATSGTDELFSYLSQFGGDAVAPVTAGTSAVDGRVFYNDDFSGLNIERGNATIRQILGQIKTHGGREPPPLVYLASADIDECLPGFRDQNDLPDLGTRPIVSAWIGTNTRVAAHNDLPLNLACVVSGRRRFMLFPPDQTSNLYVGPFEHTPAGRPISLVDFADPDLAAYPKFADAMKVAQVAEMGPGDVLFIPSMWWHHVEATGPFNMLVNYWWRTTPSYLGTPQDALHHAIMTLRDLPEGERAIWREMFEHYVFSGGDAAAAHIPDSAKGLLDSMTEARARAVRAYLLNRLNR